MITIKEEIAVPSPRERVWEVVSDPASVVSCINGAELGAAHDDGSFDGSLLVKFGAIRVRFAARVSLELDEPEHEGRLSARGGDGQGATRFRGEATFRVVEDEEAGGARVVMAGEVVLTGKLASLVESGAGAVVSRMTKDFSAQLVQRCTAPAGESAAVPGVAPAPAVPAAGPPRRGWLHRCRAWFGRVLRRRRQPPPAPDRPAPSAPATSPRPTETKEIGSGNAPAQ